MPEPKFKRPAFSTSFSPDQLKAAAEKHKSQPPATPSKKSAETTQRIARLALDEARQKSEELAASRARLGIKPEPPIEDVEDLTTLVDDEAEPEDLTAFVEEPDEEQEIPIEIDLAEYNLIELQREKEIPAREVPEIQKTLGIRASYSMEMKEKRKAKGQPNEDCVGVSALEKYKTVRLSAHDGAGGEGAKGAAAKASRLADVVIGQSLGDKIAQGELIGVDTMMRTLSNARIARVDGMDSSTMDGQELRGAMETLLRSRPDVASRAYGLLASLKEANDAVLTEAKGGKTTACDALVYDGYAIIANVGDGGAFVENPDGSVEMLTREDSAEESIMTRLPNVFTEQLIQEMRDNPDKLFGIPINEETGPVLADMLGATVQQLEQAFKTKQAPINYNYIRRANGALLGGDLVVKPRLTIQKLKPGAKLINGTDGLFDFFENPKTRTTDMAAIAEVLAQAKKNKQHPLDALRAAVKVRAADSTLGYAKLGKSQDDFGAGMLET